MTVIIIHIFLVKHYYFFSLLILYIKIIIAIIIVLLLRSTLLPSSHYVTDLKCNKLRARDAIEFARRAFFFDDNSQNHVYSSLT